MMVKWSAAVPGGDGRHRGDHGTPWQTAPAMLPDIPRQIGPRRALLFRVLVVGGHEEPQFLLRDDVFLFRCRLI